MSKEKNQDTQPLIQAELEGYSALLADIRTLISQAQGRAYQAVDNIRVQAYWQIGERIVRAELEHQDRAEYGQEVIKRLAVDLSISERNLYNAVAFYRAYPILQTVSALSRRRALLFAELSWSHYVSLTQLDDREERRFYEVQAIRSGWSVRELRKNIQSDLYQQAKARGELVTTTPSTEEVRYALSDLEEKIFVAEYKLRLPKEEEIKHLLEKSSNANASFC